MKPRSLTDLLSPQMAVLHLIKKLSVPLLFHFWTSEQSGFQAIFANSISVEFSFGAPVRKFRALPHTASASVPARTSNGGKVVFIRVFLSAIRRFFVPEMRREKQWL